MNFLLYCDIQVEEEYKTPGSQKREALGKMPQMWGQSLYVLASLVKEVSAILSCFISLTLGILSLIYISYSSLVDVFGCADIK